MQEQEGAEYGDNQTDSDNDSALESHSQHQNDYNDNDGFNQVDYESPQRSSYTLRLIEHFVALYTGGQAVFFQLRQFLLYGGADFYNIRSAGGRDKNALRPFAVEEQFVAGRFFVSFFDTGNVAHTELVVVMSLNQHIAYVFYRLEFIADSDADAVVSVVVITAVCSLVLSVQGSENFGRFHAEVCHAVLQQGDVDTFGTFAVQLHSVYVFHVTDFPLDEFGIVRQFTVGQSVACQCIEHSVHIAEIIFDDRGTRSVGKQGASVVYLAAQHVPALLHLFIPGGSGQFYLYQRKVVVRVAFHIVYVSHAADALFQHIRHFQFHLVGGCSRICGHHHGKFHFNFRVF